MKTSMTIFRGFEVFEENNNFQKINVVESKKKKIIRGQNL